MKIRPSTLYTCAYLVIFLCFNRLQILPSSLKSGYCLQQKNYNFTLNTYVMTSVKLIKSRDCFCKGQLSRLVHVVYHIPRFDLKDCNCFFRLSQIDLEHTYTK